MAEALDQPVAVAHGPVGRSIEWACAAMAVLAGVAFCIESVMSVVSVIGRATLGKPVPGDYEIVQMLSAMGIAAPESSHSERISSMAPKIIRTARRGSRSLRNSSLSTPS